jgi:PilZ domain-containing protein
MIPGPERRRMSRVSAAVEVVLTTAEGSELLGQLEDVGVLGLRMRAARALPLGTSCWVRFHAEDDVLVEASATIVRVLDERLAVRFERLPYECYERLRDFLRRRADDPSAVDEELADRLGFLTEP